MTTANPVAFNAIPVSTPDAAGGQRLQVAAFFRKRLYVGVVSLTEGSDTPGIARILRYYPGAKRWETVCETLVATPHWPGERQRKKFPLELGWRAMTVIPTANGQTALCLSLLCPRNPRLFYSQDGDRFEMLPAGNQQRPFGGLHCFQGWTFGALAGAMSDGTTEKSEGGGLLYVSRDPRTGTWAPANAPGFGDPHNQVIHGLQVCHDRLYAAAGNPFAGFQLWRTQAQGDPPFHWEPVLQQGAHRHTLNSAVAAMAVLRDALYLGTGVPPTERSPKAAAGCEIIRILPTGRWELVVGQPRFSPIGLQVPVSTRGPGFDDARHTVLAALASSGSALYAATLHRDAETVSGFQLWQTADGESWQPLTLSTDSAVSYLPRALIALPKFLLAAGTWRGSPDATLEPCLWFGQF